MSWNDFVYTGNGFALPSMLHLLYPRNNVRCHAVPERPWSQICVNLFVFNNQQYLTTILDSVDLLNTTTSKQVTMHWKSQFTHHDNNGPQFSSDIFKQFVSDYSFDHRTLSPHYPWSNGMAKWAVQTVKNLIKQASLTKEILIWHFRNTEIHQCLGFSYSMTHRVPNKTQLPTWM